MNHGSLFSGIGGFDLAAQWCGWNNIFQVEIDKFCQKVLKKNFPESNIYSDIKDFTNDAKKYKNKIDVISGGFPCQPFSVAGQRKGTEDHRFLWTEMFEVIRIIKPEWCVIENVPGLITIENGLVFDKVLSDLESEAYEVQPVIIPAISVNAQHRRDRIWIIANSESKRTCSRFGKVSGEDEKISERNKNTEFSNSAIPNNATYSDSIRGRRIPGQEQILSDKNGSVESKLRKEYSQFENTGGIKNPISNKSQRFEREERRLQEYFGNSRFDREDWNRNWVEVAAELCGVANGISKGLDKNRVNRLKALGNAIVPQVAYNIFQSIQKTYEQTSK